MANEFEKLFLKGADFEGVFNQLMRVSDPRPMCGTMHLLDCGTRLIQCFPYLERGEKPPAASISVYQMRFKPDNPDDLKDLVKLVRQAVEYVSICDAEFRSP